ncbi:WG repeat-containing protein [Pasteurella skyensis]|uniref:WG repeat-containing protein n=1 Tax=Phocoenobacter skyensis TaxID=97481 RepID=A0AAJ6N9W0_9PAST|nr:WG repeat-containing protein [Pasteurella skyensis]MDP8162949.1 WG repeat-containing protein [Pasteurella skyensis]MDP8172899.1 WG repeat-containing protein [Pasteurella skyensis]MDP8176655.1 WG repeat-containing protein [Pasteurella skyensis]MDP8179399.1 WG repeat-containing protein [Pasteurella skyensis]MDP8183559.1 WG repeat-containing protein [Pasteurella skyensis]
MKKLLLTTLMLSAISVSQATVFLPYEDIDSIDDHLVVYKNNQIGVLDKAGKLMTPLMDGEIIAIFDDVIISRTENKVTFTDNDGKVVLETNHRFIDIYDDKLVQLKDHDNWEYYLVDHKGNKVEVNKNDVIYKNRKIENKDYNKYALIDTTTNKVLVSVGKYKEIRKFNKFDLAEVKKGYDKLGFIDLNGQEVVPCLYSNFRVLDMGYIAFETQQRLWGIMDRTGKIILKAQYDNIKNYHSSDFSKDIALIRLDNREGFLDKNLTEIIPPKYQDIDLVDRTKDLVELELNGKTKIINREFKELFANNNYDDIAGDYNFKDLLRVKKDELYGLFTKEEKEIIPVKYPYISKMKGDFIKVATADSLYGAYDTTGKIIAPAIYKRLWFSSPMFFYELNDKDRGRMDLAGNKINLAEYEKGFVLSSNLLAVKKEKGNWGLIDNNKKTVLDFDYESMRYLSDDKLLFRKKAFFGLGKAGKWGVMDIKGDVITDSSFTIYKSVSRRFIPDNLLTISTKAFNVGFLDKETGKIAIEPKYNELLNGFTEKEQQYLFVRSNDGAGVLNLTQKKEIVPPKYDDLKMLNNDFFVAYKGSIWSVYDNTGKKLYERKTITK